MSTWLLLKLAGPVPSWKKCAATVIRLPNTARYPLKTCAIDMWRCIILRRIHCSSKIRPATQTQKPCYSVTQCIRAGLGEYFVVNISAPLVGSDLWNYSIAKILQRYHTAYGEWGGRWCTWRDNRSLDGTLVQRYAPEKVWNEGETACFLRALPSQCCWREVSANCNRTGSLYKVLPRL